MGVGSLAAGREGEVILSMTGEWIYVTSYQQPCHRIPSSVFQTSLSETGYRVAGDPTVCVGGQMSAVNDYKYHTLSPPEGHLIPPFSFLHSSSPPAA